MAINCPYCKHHIHVIRGARTGKFFPRCSRCQKKYILVVPQDPYADPIAHAIQVGADPGDTITPDIADALGLGDTDLARRMELEDEEDQKKAE